MPAISRDLDLAKTGHLCTPIIGVEASQNNVIANGIPVLRPGDWCLPHTIKCGPVCCGHPAMINRGSSSVFAVGIPVARIGDSTDFGFMIKGSSSVFAGG
jgi:uncharacterized Zn-binding protein involved in type VI secretion